MRPWCPWNWMYKYMGAEANDIESPVPGVITIMFSPVPVNETAIPKGWRTRTTTLNCEHWRPTPCSTPTEQLKSQRNREPILGRPAGHHHSAVRHPRELILRSGTKLKPLSNYCSRRVQFTKCDFMGPPQGCLDVALSHHLP